MTETIITKETLEMAQAWFKRYGVETSTEGSEKMYVVLENEDRTYVQITDEEISYRAELEAGIEEMEEED